MKNKGIEPIIEVDGGYAKCGSCHEEVFPNQQECPRCHQTIDWSWLHDKTENGE